MDQQEQAARYAALRGALADYKAEQLQLGKAEEEANEIPLEELVKRGEPMGEAVVQAVRDAYRQYYRQPESHATDSSISYRIPSLFVVIDKIVEGQL